MTLPQTAMSGRWVHSAQLRECRYSQWPEQGPSVLAASDANSNARRACFTGRLISGSERALGHLGLKGVAGINVLLDPRLYKNKGLHRATATDHVRSHTTLHFGPDPCADSLQPQWQWLKWNKCRNSLFVWINPRVVSQRLFDKRSGVFICVRVERVV